MPLPRPIFTAIIPFYNEESFLLRTLESWIQQERLPDRMILIDNASTDQSHTIAAKFKEDFKHLVPITLIEEKTPGKVYALAKAQLHLDGDWAAYCDADTWYPPHYLKKAEELILSSPETLVSVMAIDVSENPNQSQNTWKLFYKLLVAKAFPKKCHTGGFGQIFKTSAIKSSGGFGADLWAHVLMDHEIVYRIHQYGDSIYHKDMWCIPSSRRGDRTRVRWTKWERFIYFIHPYFLGKWFFHSFLKARFLKRKLSHLNLRNQPWHAKES